MRAGRIAADVKALAIALAVLAGLTAALAGGLRVTNSTTIALLFLLVVLVLAARARLWAAIVASIAAMLLINFWFLPPLRTFTIADPQNWIALFAFLTVSLVATNLSSAARARASEAMARRDELTRLFDLSRDVLRIGDTANAMTVLASFVVRRFSLSGVSICLPASGSWTMATAPAGHAAPTPDLLDTVLGRANRTLEFDARQRSYGGQQQIETANGPLTLVPLRLGTRAIGVMAAGGRPLESGTLDAIAGLVAIAVERTQFLEERERAELASRTADLKSALLASLAHDLRTPLTAIHLAASNLQARWLSDSDRDDQAGIVLAETARLQRMFQNILDMARLEAGGVDPAREWVAPDQIVEAARAQAGPMLDQREVRVHVSEGLVDVDPRLTATALAHLIENAAQYSPADKPIEITAHISSDGLHLDVRDHGPGIAPADLSHLFEGFYRGAGGAVRAAGTGLGLTIAKRFLAVEDGRIWAESCPDGGARFSITVPAATRSAPSAIES